VRRLRGLTPEEKLAAMMLADHEHYKTGEINVSMSTLAVEAGWKNRESASHAVAGLFRKKIFLTDTGIRSKGRNPTSYRLNFDLLNCEPEITVEGALTVNLDSQSSEANRESNRESGGSNREPEPVENASTVNPNGSNREPQFTGRVLREKKERENLEGEEGEVRSTSTPAVEAEVRTAFELLRIPPFGSWEQKCDWTAFVSTANGLPVTALLEAFFQSRKNRGLRIGKEWTEVKRAWERRQARDAIHPEQQGRSRPSGALPAEPGKYANRKPDFSGD